MLPSRVVGLEKELGLVKMPTEKGGKVGVVDDVGVVRCMAARVTR